MTGIKLPSKPFEVGKKYFTQDKGACTVISRTRCYISVKFYKNPEHANYFDRVLKLHVDKTATGVEYVSIMTGLRSDQLVGD